MTDPAPQELLRAFSTEGPMTLGTMFEVVDLEEDTILDLSERFTAEGLLEICLSTERYTLAPRGYSMLKLMEHNTPDEDAALVFTPPSRQAWI